ncbi:hypothetical protein O0235_10645 [Tepidiforma flava]|uniref:ABC transporter permease n=1 Tax=Tepidiforma flava TaxID=3004094 RepID=A0ABY7M3W1_9CHLR|nr:hypothetical protein [Tepidiforma flava]WBL35244.1 hypothetical protein O0235_10645 [Tepidiforma flava]
MGQYLAKRVLLDKPLVVLFVISIVVFTAVRMIPGDVCKIVLNTEIRTWTRRSARRSGRTWGSISRS